MDRRLDKLLEDFSGDFTIRLWDGRLIKRGSEPKFTIVFRDKKVFKKFFLLRNEYFAGKAYLMKQIDVEGDLFEALKFGDALLGLKLNIFKKIKLFTQILFL